MNNGNGIYYDSDTDSVNSGLKPGDPTQGVMIHNTIWKYSGIDFDTTLTMANTGISFYWGLDEDYKMGIKCDENGMVITDSYLSKGVSYAADYSDQFTDRSIPDRAFTEKRLNLLRPVVMYSNSSGEFINDDFIDRAITAVIGAGGTFFDGIDFTKSFSSNQIIFVDPANAPAADTPYLLIFTF